MRTPREACEAELRQLLTTNEGLNRLREEYEQITEKPIPAGTVTYINALLPEILDRRVQYTEVAIMLKDFFPPPEALSSLSPQEIGEQLLFFFENLILKKQHRNAIKRDYIGGRYPVQSYPAHLQQPVTRALLEGWDWLVSQGFLVKENKSDSFLLSRLGESYLKQLKDKQGRFVIFYSWQSDLPRSRNLDFIQECIADAIAAISAENIQLIPCLDRDTEGEPGAPDIAETIFAKIDNCDMFACDVSIIVGTGTVNATPNPNVLLELGYAAKRLGWARVTNILNNAYGKIEELPFDLRKRRVVKYSLKPEENKTSAKKALVVALSLQIKACIQMGKVTS
jgi:hypothetical protein